MSGDLLRDLLATFAVEAREHLQTISGNLLELERTPEGAERERLLAELFRAAHSLKGAARAVGAEEVEAIAHDLESQFDMFRSGELEPDPAVIDGVYRSVDSMASRVDRAIGGEASRAEPSDGSTVVPPASTQDREPPTPPAPEARAADETVRVTTSKLDSLVAQVGEMHVAQAESEQWGAELRGFVGELAAVPHLQTFNSRLTDLDRDMRAGERRRAQLTADLQKDVRRMRMLPLTTILEAFPRMVRDLARHQQKEIDLVIEGSDTEVDRFILEQIKDPLMHLLRNCVDHGIEKPDERLSEGKPQKGTVTVKARQQGDQLRLEITDDGMGVDPEGVKEAAVSRGLLTAETARAMDDREALWLIFRSSVSTSPIVTDLSGRGVGLDVVHETVERLQGTIDVDSRTGEGTRFTLTVPLAVAATRCLLVEAGGQRFALPISSVARILRLGPGDVGRAGGGEAINLDGEPIALAPLSVILGIESVEGSRSPAGSRVAVVVGSAGRHVALVVDEVAGEHDAVIKALPRPLVRAPGTAGATILGTGQVVLVLSMIDVVRGAERVLAPTAEQPARETEAVPTLLVADDSMTTRTMEKNILEAAGYLVRVAADGAEAWRLLQQTDVQLVVSDVTMPGFDGFELTRKVRADKRLKDLPVILVTSLASDEDRERGIEAGADAYIVKGAFDQDRLLDTVRRLV